MKDKLKNLVKYKEGYAFYRESKSRQYKFSDNTNVMPVVNARNFSNGIINENYVGNTCVPINLIQKYKKYILKPNDILMSTRGVIGRIGLFTSRPVTCLLNQHILSIKTCNPSILDNSYLYWVLRSKKFLAYVQSRAQGSVQKLITLKAIFDYEINLPSIDVQKKQSKLLNDINRKIFINSKITNTSINLANLVFLKDFPNAYHGADKLGNNINIYDKYTVPLTKKIRRKIPGKYRYIGASSVMTYINKYNFDGNYILMGKDGTVHTEKYTPILRYIWGKFWPNDHVHVLKGKSVSDEWLYFFLKNLNVKSIITGAVVPSISQGRLKSVSINIYDYNKRKKFQRFASPIFQQIQNLSRQNNILLRLQQTLNTKFIH